MSVRRIKSEYYVDDGKYRMAIETRLGHAHAVFILYNRSDRKSPENVAEGYFNPTYAILTHIDLYPDRAKDRKPTKLIAMKLINRFIYNDRINN